MTAPRFLVAAFTTLALAACGDGGHGGGDGPAAPSGLGAEALSGGAHLTWTDNADNETEYMVMRKQGTAEFTIVATLPFNTQQYHDAPLVSGMTYIYMVMAMNDAGESNSNEVTFAAP